MTDRPGDQGYREGPISWPDWHRAYDDPTGWLAQRLAVVQRLIGAELDRTDQPIRVISLCAGAGDDLIGALTPRPPRHGTRALLVERDGTMAARARWAAARASLSGIAVREADAALSDTYRDEAPVELVLCCGVLGNLTPTDIQRTISGLASLVTRDGAVIWTRHRHPPDATPNIRHRLEAAGFAEEAFVSPGPGAYAVGLHRRTADPLPLPVSEHWFAFTRRSADDVHHEGLRSGMATGFVACRVLGGVVPTG